MDFGKILEDWEKNQGPEGKKKACPGAENPPGGLDQAKSPGGAGQHRRPGKAGQGSGQGALPAVDPLTAWLRTHGTYDKDAEAREEELSSAERRHRLHAARPDAVLDLHGLTRDEAWDRLTSFFASVKRQGAEKILIVHGKGNHSAGEAVLKRTVREFIERSPYAGEHGHAPAAAGGSGATWVILK